MCAWEGGVTFDADEAARTEDALYVSGDVAWSPCCGDTSSDQRSFRIDAASGATERAEIPEGAEVVSLPGTDEPVVIDFPTPGTRIELAADPMDSVLSERLEIGAVLDAATDVEVAVVEIDVGR